MIHVDLEEMDFNFRCEFRDARNRKHRLLLAGKSEEELRQWLEDRDCRVVRIQEYGVDDWKKKAEEETRKVIEAVDKGETPNFNNRIWSEIKDCLFRAFNGKCAYCEARARHVTSGDVEHFRPKGKVEDDPNHPGYYWLAYDCTNLLPSCEKCNRSLAKMNHFPVAGERAYKPEDIEKEKPLLLNPYTDKPENHLKFPPGRDGTFLGTVVATTERGEASITFYHLDREELVEDRRREQEYVERDLDYCLIKDRTRLKDVIEDIDRGNRQYSAAAYAQFHCWVEQLEAESGMKITWPGD